ncbi:MAG: ABC transporter permease [Phycisphaerales bacterium]|nr:ABC transporter permease [Phycisphaerales bacterium]
MATYILRRLLLMIPTLIGITFLIFMLMALAPGGIGASLQVSAGGQRDQTSAAVQKAYLEDRFGLDDPVVVQYVRWLGRISPVKFGERDQYAPDGERLSLPKAIKAPPMWKWFADALPTAPPASFAWPEDEWTARGLDAEGIAKAKESIFRGISNETARARSAYIGAIAAFQMAVGQYAGSPEVARPDIMNREGKIREALLTRLGPDRDAPRWAEVERTGRAMLSAYARAIETRELKLAAFRAKPYRQAGVWIIPGYLSIAMPDLGTSFKQRGRPVFDMILQALPVTIMLNLIALPIIYLIAVPTGMLAAARRGSFFDIASGAFFIALYSIPVVVAGVLIHGFVCNNEYLGAFPVAGLNRPEAEMMTFLPSTGADGAWQRGWLLDRAWHIAMPVACLVYTGFAVLSKQTRAAMLDNFNADYVRTAKAKGVSSRDVVLRHVFRNSLLPLITIFASVFPAMLAGSVIIEKIFTIPGMGSLALSAINDRDRELLLAVTLMTGIVNLLALLLADILYALADPRVTFD